MPDDEQIILNALPEWGEREQEMWLDAFNSVSELLMGARCDPDATGRIHGMIASERFDALKEDLDMSGELADAAVEIMRTRFDVQKEAQKAKQRRAKKVFEETRKRTRTRR